MLTHINFQSLTVEDQDRAVAFYRDMLGMRVHTDAPYMGDARWIFMEIPGAKTKLELSKGTPQKSETPQLILATEDVDSACAALHAKGVALLKGPEDAPWDPATRWALLHDSEGNLVMLQTV
ncbi:MAG: VOC family protein [Pseudomonadota bacterium]